MMECEAAIVTVWSVGNSPDDSEVAMTCKRRTGLSCPVFA